MLTDDDYDKAKALLLEHGFRIVRSSGHNGPFGSWLITVRIDACRGLRLVYEGKDNCSYVQIGEIGQPEAFNFQKVSDLSIDYTPGEGTVDKSVAVMLEAAGLRSQDAPC